MDQAQPLPRLSRKEFADAIRGQYPQETEGLTDDDVIEVVLQEDPDAKDALETPAATLFRESGAPAPPSLAPALPSREIPPPQEAYVDAINKSVPAPLRGAERYVRSFGEGIKEGLTGGLYEPNVGSQDPGAARLAGGFIGGAVPTVAAGIVAGVPGLVAAGALQGAAGATRTNLNELEIAQQEAGAKAQAAQQDFTRRNPSVVDTITPRGVTRVAAQAATQGALNFLPPIVRNSKLGSMLANAAVGGMTAPVPVAIDQVIDQGKVDLTDPFYANAYRTAATIGAAGGAAVGITRGGKPLAAEAASEPIKDPNSHTGKVYYDQGPGKPPGAEWFGNPGAWNAEGWLTPEDETFIGPGRVRQIRQVPNPLGGNMVEVRWDDGSITALTEPFEVMFPKRHQKVTINPRHGARSGYPPKGPDDPPGPPAPPGPAALGEGQRALPPVPEVPEVPQAPPLELANDPGMGPATGVDSPFTAVGRNIQNFVDMVGKYPEYGKLFSNPAEETGRIQAELAQHVGGATAGALIGGLQGEDDDNFDWPRAMIGAGIGLASTTSLRSYFRKLGVEREAIKRLSVHPAVEKALTRTSPGSRIKQDLKEGIRSAYETFLDDTFTPHALLHREGEAWSAKNTGKAQPGFFQPAIDALTRLTLTKFTIPPAVAEEFKTKIADVLQDDDSYELMLRIVRLRADIEQRQNDGAKRLEGFEWLKRYREAKRAGDHATATAFRQRLRTHPGILHRLSKTMRQGMTMDQATATLANLERYAKDRPDVLKAAENWKDWGRTLLGELERQGIDINEIARMNRNYFPNYDLSKMGNSPRVSVGSPAGLGKSKSGYLKQRGRQKADQNLWIDLVGPYFRRSIDQSLDLTKLETARQILTKYDPYRNGSLPPDQAATQPPGDYVPWAFSIPGENKPHAKVWGWLPTPLAAEMQKHYVPKNAFLKKILDPTNALLKGLLIRASGGSFIALNAIGNQADSFSSTPIAQWPHLAGSNLKALASTLLEATEGPLARQGVTIIDPDSIALKELSDQGRKAGIGTEAAAAEITSQALADPRIRNKAQDPDTPARIRAADAVLEPMRAYGRAFDSIREASENTTRLAQFIHLVSSNTNMDPKQAGRIVNMTQGDYSPTNLTPREQRIIKSFSIFWTFYKNAFPNWLPLVGREIAYGDKVYGGRGLKGRVQALPALGKKIAAASAVGMAANIYNHMFFPDAEASLTDHQREQFHIIVPNLTDPWDPIKKEWRLAYIGFPTPMNIAHQAVGMGAVMNRGIHYARGTGAQSIGEEVERSFEQMKNFWGGLAHPVVGIAGALINGKDPISGQPVVEPGSTTGEAVAQVLQYPIAGLPGPRQALTAAREAAEPDESPAHFVRRMLFGSLYQPLNRENQEIRALARAVSRGNRAAIADEKSAREAALFKGEQETFTPEEARSILTGQDKVSWKGKVVALSKLPEFVQTMEAVKPDDPGAVDALVKEKKTGTFDLRKSGPVFLPTRDYIRAMGPDATLKAFLETFAGGNQRQGDAWRSGAVSIVQQLRNESKNWEIPASLMMMLQQSPTGEANTEILRRVHGLEVAFDPEAQLGDKLGRKIFGQ